MFNNGNKYKLSKSVDNKKIRNNKYNNINAIQNKNINVHENRDPFYFSPNFSNENYHYKNNTYYFQESNNNQINRKRGKSSEKKINKNNIYPTETRITLDAKIKPNKNTFNKTEDQRNYIQNNYENNEITQYMLNKNMKFNTHNIYDDLSKENNKNKYLNEKNRYRLRNKSAAPTKAGSRINSYNINGNNLKSENIGNTMLLLDEIKKRGRKQTQNSKNNNNFIFNNTNNIRRINIENNFNKNYKNINNDNKNINLFKKNNAIPNNRNSIKNNNNFLVSNNNIKNNNFMNHTNNNAIGFYNNNINNNNYNINNNYKNGIYNNINLNNNFINHFNSNNNFNSNINYFNYNLNSNMQNNNNIIFPSLFNNFSNNMNFMNNNFNYGIGMGFNNFIQSNNSMNHTRSNSFDRFSHNNNINKNFNLNNSNINNILKRTDNCSKFNVIIKSPSAKGLENVGATCYMNATLQCLAHIENLTKFLLDKYNDISTNKNKYQLTYAYTGVLKNIWQNRNIDYYTPTYFKDTISEMNSLFAGVQANDSKDLVLFLMETMHNELNKPIKNKNQGMQLFPNQYNYDITFYLFSEYFIQNYRSVISHLFYGMYNSMMKCFNCNVITHNVQCFNILIFPLEEVRKYKKRTQNVVDIKECFEFYQKNEYMTGENQIYCNHCNTMSDCCNFTKLIICPNVLVINLNRGKGLEYDVMLNFGEYLNIRGFVYYRDQSPTNYELIGIVTHFGPSSMGGHFIAFCKSFVDHQWYKYNDAIVSPSSFSEANSTGVPYILFYSSK